MTDPNTINTSGLNPEVEAILERNGGSDAVADFKSREHGIESIGYTIKEDGQVIFPSIEVFKDIVGRYNNLSIASTDEMIAKMGLKGREAAFKSRSTDDEVDELMGDMAKEQDKKALVRRKSPIAEALRQKVIELATQGDPRTGNTFTANIASQIERLVHAGREILLVEGLPLDGLKSLMKGKKRRRGMGYNPGGIVTNLTDLDDMGLMEPDYMDGVIESTNGSLGDLLGPGSSENFGVQSIQQLVGALTAHNDSPVKDIQALALARKEGLTDVVQMLEEKLGLTKTPATEDRTYVQVGDPHDKPAFKSPSEKGSSK